MIADIVARRGITEILHFTTNQGVLGILDSKKLRCRNALRADERLEFILKLNAQSRARDVAWHGYANLSISRINSEFFRWSFGWHKDEPVWWCILSFDPCILEHAGVVFTTTNNVYTYVRRAAGEAGLEGAFAHRVAGKSGIPIERYAALPSHFTTCEQAEVLYPDYVDTAYLRKIYVATDSSADELAGQLSAIGQAHFPVVVAPNYFESIPNG